VSTPPPETIYLEGAPEPVAVTLHRAASELMRDTAVMFCPPFGWDEVCSYRSLRDWAQRLAATGYPSIRLSFPGTGDSGGSPRDVGRLEAWTAAAAATARWVRAATGARRLVAVGIEIGGLIAYRAAASGAPIDDLVLWATPARARASVRQLRAFSRLEMSQFFEGLEQPPPLPPGELEAGGFLLSRETVQELEGLDLTALPLPDASARRVLLLERDGIAVDARLREPLEASGAAVTVARGHGYASMTSHPQRAVPPLEVIERVTAWLDTACAAVAPDAVASPVLAPGASTSAEMLIGAAAIKETPLTLPQAFGNVAGVLAEPLGHREPGPCAILLNAGAVRRIGPNRMWVEVARRWAARGVPTLRLDVEGIGDADGATTPYFRDGSLYMRELVPQVLATIDVLEKRGVGDRFVLVGLCAGAYWSFHAALGDPRVSSAVMINPRRLIWDPSLGPARDFRALRANLTSWSKIRQEASWERASALAVWAVATPRRKISQWRPGPTASSLEREMDDVLDQVRAAGKRLTLVFSNHEPLHHELIESGRWARLEQWENVTLEYIAVRDHTLRPNWAQREAHAVLDRALARELQIHREAPATPVP
jgi:alpha-beta hydrolase superfamily lysophospholipase